MKDINSKLPKFGTILNPGGIVQYVFLHLKNPDNSALTEQERKLADLPGAGTCIASSVGPRVYLPFWMYRGTADLPKADQEHGKTGILSILIEDEVVSYLAADWLLDNAPAQDLPGIKKIAEMCEELATEWWMSQAGE